MDFVKIGNLKKLIPQIDVATRFENEKFEVGVTH